MRDYDWNDLRFFLEVARIGTLSGAAKTLATDHATVGRRVSALERSLGQNLFLRAPTGYALTPSGSDLLPLAEQMEALALRSAQASGGRLAVMSGVVRLVAPDGFGNFFLSRHLPGFAEANPRLRVQLVAVQQIQAGSQREGDVVVTLAPPQRGHFATEKLTDYELGVYAAPAYLEASTAVVARGDLRQHRLVGYVDDLIFTRELDYLNEVLPGLRAQIQCSSLLSQVTAVREGGGLGILPHYIARQFGDLSPVLPDIVRLKRTYWMNTPSDSTTIGRVMAVQAFLRAAIRTGL